MLRLPQLRYPAPAVFRFVCFQRAFDFIKSGLWLELRNVALERRRLVRVMLLMLMLLRLLFVLLLLLEMRFMRLKRLRLLRLLRGLELLLKT